MLELDLRVFLRWFHRGVEYSHYAIIRDIGDGGIFIANLDDSPCSDDNHRSFKVGQEISVAWNSLEGGKRLVSSVLAISEDPDNPGCLVRPPGKEDIETLNRRTYYRLELCIPCTVSTVRGGRVLEGVTCDISGGGARLVLRSDSSLKHEGPLQIELTLPDNKKIRAMATQVRDAANIPLSRLNKNEVPTIIMFTDIHQNDRDTIVALIFKEQLRIRRERNS